MFCVSNTNRTNYTNTDLVLQRQDTADTEKNSRL